MANQALPDGITFHRLTYHDVGVSAEYSSQDHYIELYWEYGRRGPLRVNVEVKPDRAGEACVTWVGLEKVPLGHAGAITKPALEKHAIQHAKEVVGPLPDRPSKGHGVSAWDYYKYALAIQELYNSGCYDIVSALSEWTGNTNESVWRSRMARARELGVLRGRQPYMQAISPDEL